MRTVHLTCFDAFGALPENPTRALVAALSPPPGWRAVKTVLPTSYARVGPEVNRIFDQRPAAVIMFGYTGQADRLRLEHVARNRDGSRRPDNDGRVGGPVILPGGPPAHWSTVNLTPVLGALYGRALPFTYSVDAGGYVCNHSYFLALDRAWSASRAVPCLFVHIPWPRTGAQRSQIREGAAIALRGVLRAAAADLRTAALDRFVVDGPAMQFYQTGCGSHTKRAGREAQSCVTCRTRRGRPAAVPAAAR